MIHPIAVRLADPADVAALLTLIKEHAAYEGLERDCVATAENLHRHLFGARKAAEVLLVEAAGQPVGYALFFTSFSTFRAQPCLFLEDMFVRPEHRHSGAGTTLLQRLAQLGVERDCGRLEWCVLAWNELAIGFYNRIGASHMHDWNVYHLDRAGMETLAGR